MILSPHDDFKNRTLKVFPSLLEKLAYVSSLLGLDGIYQHWGLFKAYGEQKANAAIGAAHADLAREALKTPIREIYRQFENSEIDPDTLTLSAPPSADAILSDHLQLYQDSVRTIAGQERSNRRDA